MKNEVIEKKYLSLKKEFLKIGYISTGSVMYIYHKCGNPRCLCAKNKKSLHGPYNRWTRKEKGKTITRTLTNGQARIAKMCIANYRKLEMIIAKMKKLSVEYIEYQRKKIKLEKNTKKL